MHLEEHVLCEILRETAICHHPGDEPEHQILVAVDELAERGVVTGTAPLDQLAIFDIPSAGDIQVRPAW